MASEANDQQVGRLLVDSRLEAVLVAPLPSDEHGWIAVVTHPHPKLGGSMNNNVTTAVCRRLVAEGVACLLFNTRGVGRSRGEATWRGVDEREDIRAALVHAATLRPNVLFVGYSFGAAVGLSVLAAQPTLATAVCVVGYPKGFFAGFIFSAHYASADPGPGVPKLFLLGDRDDFTAVDTLRAFVDAMSQPHTVQILPDCDHFFFGKERQLTDAIVAWLRTSTSALSSSS